MSFWDKKSTIRQRIQASNEEIHRGLDELRQEINSVVVMLTEKDDLLQEEIEKNQAAVEMLSHYRDVISGLTHVIRDPTKYVDAVTRFFTPAYYHENVKSYPDSTSVLTLISENLPAISPLVLDFCHDHQAVAILWKQNMVKIFLHGVKPLAREQITALLSEWDHAIVAQHRLKINDLDLR